MARRSLTSFSRSSERATSASVWAMPASTSADLEAGPVVALGQDADLLTLGLELVLETGGLGSLVVDGRRRRQRLPHQGEHQCEPDKNAEQPSVTWGHQPHLRRGGPRFGRTLTLHY